MYEHESLGLERSEIWSRIWRQSLGLQVQRFRLCDNTGWGCVLPTTHGLLGFLREPGGALQDILPFSFHFWVKGLGTMQNVVHADFIPGSASSL